MNSQECNRCHGEGLVIINMKDRAGRQSDGIGIDATIACPQCDGKGFVTDEDTEAYYRSIDQ